MKKFLFVIACILISIAGITQSKVGIKAGFNYFLLTSSDDKTNDYAAGGPGYLFGLTVDLPITTAFSVQPEVLYSYQTARSHYVGAGSLRLSYIQLPVLLKYKVASQKVSIGVGPQFGFLTNVESRESVYPPVSKTDLIQSDFGVTLGVGFVTSHGLTFDFRGYRGVMNTFKNKFDGGVKTRGSMLTATIGYIFNNK